MARLGSTPYSCNVNSVAASKTPPYPGVDGMATPKPMIPCRSSAASSGTSSPKARKQIANAAAFLIQSTSDQRTTPAKRAGLLSTASPSTMPSETRTTRSAAVSGKRRRATRSTNTDQRPGRLAMSSAITSNAPNSAAVDAAMAESERPPTRARAGKDGAAIAKAIRPSMTSASNTRSTPMEPSAVVKRTGSWREATYARATSPARAGSRLFAMKPIVVACHSGNKRNGRPSPSRRIRRQRIARTGKVTVATTTVSSSSQTWACCAYAQTLRGSILYSTHTSRAALMASPISQAPRQRFFLLGFDGEDNEIADFVDDRAEGVAARALRRFAQLLRALPGTRALVEQGPDIDRLSIRSGDPGPRARGSADQLLERRRSHAGRDHPLIPHPRARDVRRRVRADWQRLRRRGRHQCPGRGKRRHRTRILLRVPRPRRRRQGAAYWRGGLGAPEFPERYTDDERGAGGK